MFATLNVSPLSRIFVLDFIANWSWVDFAFAQEIQCLRKCDTRLGCHLMMLTHARD